MVALAKFAAALADRTGDGFDGDRSAFFRKHFMRNMNYVTTDLSPINDGRQRALANLLRFLDEKDKEGEILLLYRGESLQNLRQKLGSESASLQEIFDRCFYVGDKARHFFYDQRAPHEQTYLTTINDCSLQTLRYIFDRIAAILVSPKLDLRVRKRTSSAFRTFFSDPANRELFVQPLDSIEDEETKLKLRDYFLYFLHVAGRSGVYRETMFVSTTTDIEVARRFASARGPVPGKSWMPRVEREPSVIFHYAIAPWQAEHDRHLVKELGLPTFQSKGLFPSQNEVAVKGALFPQFMLGLELLDGLKSYFIPNPHALEIANGSYDDVAIYGIQVNQTDFAERISETNYIRWNERDGEGRFEEHEVIRK
jgi:hypothetical protein